MPFNYARERVGASGFPDIIPLVSSFNLDDRNNREEGAGHGGGGFRPDILTTRRILTLASRITLPVLCLGREAAETWMTRRISYHHVRFPRHHANDPGLVHLLSCTVSILHPTNGGRSNLTKRV